MKIRYIIFLILVASIIGGYLYLEEKNHTGASKIIKDHLVTTDDGLYMDDISTGLNEDLAYSSKYYFKGEKVNNFFLHKGLCFRIINIAQNDAIKVAYVGKGSSTKCSNLEFTIGNEPFNNEEDNNFVDSNINDILETYINENKIDGHKFPVTEVFEKATWYMNGIKLSGNKLIENIEYEQGLLNDPETYKSFAGIISITDYLKASCEMSVYLSSELCGEANYLYNNQNYFTMNKVLWDSSNVFTVTDGMAKPMQSTSDEYTFHPTFYLKSDFQLTGDGSYDNPYMIK